MSADGEAAKPGWKVGSDRRQFRPLLEQFEPFFDCSEILISARRTPFLFGISSNGAQIRASRIGYD
jgi:hypothetical protein